PHKTLISVDFPAPFSPINACTSPLFTVKFTPCNTLFPENALSIPVISTKGVPRMMPPPIISLFHHHLDALRIYNEPSRSLLNAFTSSNVGIPSCAPGFVTFNAETTFAYLAASSTDCPSIYALANAPAKQSPAPTESTASTCIGSTNVIVSLLNTYAPC